MCNLLHALIAGRAPGPFAFLIIMDIVGGGPLWICCSAKCKHKNVHTILGFYKSLLPIIFPINSRCFNFIIFLAFVFILFIFAIQIL